MVVLRVLGTPVKVRPAVLVNIAGLWGGVTWVGLRRHPERPLGQAAGIGLVATGTLLVADFGHCAAHTVSARYAGAPMDEILITAGMPRTLYWDDDVSPDAHRLRAVGGPIFSALGLLLSAATYAYAPRGSAAREVAAWSAAGHGAILAGSLAPLPIVDGGVLLKWTLVARGRSAAEADVIVGRAGWALGLAGAAAGAGLIATRRRLAGAAVLGLSAVVIGVAAGKIR